MSDGPPSIPSLHDAARPTRQAAMLSVAAAVVLSAVKLVGWWLSGSIGLLASLADSGLDMVAAAGTLAAVRYATTPPDAEHRFGHGKAEAFASLLQAALIFVSATLVAREAVARLVQPKPLQTEPLGVGILAVSTVVALGVAAAQARALQRSRSVAVKSDRLHYLADAGANLVALAGLGAAALLTSPRLDAAAGLLVALGLAWGGVLTLRNAADSIMDRELGDAEREQILALASADPQIHHVHDLRTRAAGPIVHIQLHAAMDPRLPLEQVHRVVIQAERRILERFPSADILIHADPEGLAEPHSGAFAEASADLAAQERVTETPAAVREGA